MNRFMPSMRVASTVLRTNALQNPMQLPLRVIGTRLYSTQNDLQKMVEAHKVVLFMKGSPDAPQCGFSKGAVTILDMHGVMTYHPVDVLEDDAVREGIKEFSNWPTIPQLYVNGEFIGGFDIMKDLHNSEEFVGILEEAGIESSLKNI